LRRAIGLARRKLRTGTSSVPELFAALVLAAAFLFAALP
jgi:hypothetical protein